jgi:hypothetical protein
MNHLKKQSLLQVTVLAALAGQFGKVVLGNMERL